MGQNPPISQNGLEDLAAISVSMKQIETLFVTIG
jgi:hypothetical protein